ncbi:ABC transporter permease [Sanguibacter sp. 25GB23B1]|uniref:ABC transporter permease n=1 Tax=unclassified Sanguibacter TaxID=2645534 RepID=UPI0032AF9802
MIRTVTIASKDVGALPLRNLLTAVSMLLGVLAIASISAADQLVVSAVIAQHEQADGREATYEVVVPVTSSTFESADRLLDGVRDRLSETSAASALVVNELVMLHTADGRSGSVAMSWIEGDLQSIYRRPVRIGAWISAPSATAPAVALNDRAASQLGIDRVPTTLQWPASPGTMQTIVVTGILADGKSEPQAYGNLEDALSFRVASSVPTDVRLLITTASVPEVLLQTVLTDAAVYANITTSSELHRIDTVAQTRATVSLVGAAFLVCALVALSVAVVGILNVGLASVTERARELVIRRALGARRRDLLAQVLGSALAVSLTVALVSIGVVLAAVFVVLPRVSPDAIIADPVTMPWAAVVNGVLAALLTGVAGSIAPAVKACRLPVADALRA